MSFALCAPARVGAAVINSAEAVERGPIVELRFGFHGKVLAWTLSAHGDELWIDLSHTRIELPPRPLYGRESAPVTAVRAIDTGAMRSRLVIQVAGKTDYAIGKLPHELLIRLAPAGRAPNLAAPVFVRAERRAGQPSRGKRPIDERPSIASARAEPKLSLPGTGTAAAPSERVAQSRPVGTEAERDTAEPPDPSAGPKLANLQGPAPAAGSARDGNTGAAAGAPRSPMVVIDPGHGGYDSGTEVAAPLFEKDLALQIALRLSGELRARGMRTALTRTGDYFVPLADRTAYANRAGADLFISIHLNSTSDVGTAGIETYYLNNTTDRATIRLAMMENSSSGSAYGTASGGDLNYILSDMRQQYKANESVSLASMIEAQTTADLQGSLGVQVTARGAMRGPFYVLVGAHMPAVLVECGFLSNHDESARLASAQYQQVLARGIAEAVAHYFDADAAVGNL